MDRMVRVTNERRARDEAQRLKYVQQMFARAARLSSGDGGSGRRSKRPALRSGAQSGGGGGGLNPYSCTECALSVSS